MSILAGNDKYTGPAKLSGSVDAGAVLTLSRHFGLRIRFAYTNLSLSHSDVYGPPDFLTGGEGLISIQRLEELPCLYRFSVSLQYSIPLDHNTGRTNFFTHFGLGTSYLSGGWSRVNDRYLSDFELSREPVPPDSPYATAKNDLTFSLGWGISRRMWHSVSLEIGCGIEWASITGPPASALYPSISTETGVDIGRSVERIWTRTATEIRLGLSYGIGGVSRLHKGPLFSTHFITIFHLTFQLNFS